MLFSGIDDVTPYRQPFPDRSDFRIAGVKITAATARPIKIIATTSSKGNRRAVCPQ